MFAEITIHLTLYFFIDNITENLSTYELSKRSIKLMCIPTSPVINTSLTKPREFYSMGSLNSGDHYLIAKHLLQMIWVNQNVFNRSYWCLGYTESSAINKTVRRFKILMYTFVPYGNIRFHPWLFISSPDSFYTTLQLSTNKQTNKTNSIVREEKASLLTFTLVY